jgi:hypothetical protein
VSVCQGHVVPLAPAIIIEQVWDESSHAAHRTGMFGPGHETVAGGEGNAHLIFATTCCMIPRKETSFHKSEFPSCCLWWQMSGVPIKAQVWPRNLCRGRGGTGAERHQLT